MVEVNRILFLVLLIGLIYAIYKYKTEFTSCQDDIKPIKRPNQIHPSQVQSYSNTNMVECQGNKCSIYPPHRNNKLCNGIPFNNSLTNISEDNISQIDLSSLNDEDPTEKDSLFNSEDTPQNMLSSNDLNQDNTSDSFFN